MKTILSDTRAALDKSGHANSCSPPPAAVLGRGRSTRRTTRALQNARRTGAIDVHPSRPKSIHFRHGFVARRITVNCLAIAVRSRSVLGGVAPNEVDASCREASARPIAVHCGAREVVSRALEARSSRGEDSAKDNSRFARFPLRWTRNARVAQSDPVS
jgi:hypothetical protein